MASVIRDDEPCIRTEVGSMTTLFSSILATALVVQLPGETIQGKVVDDQGKPVADARVFYVASLLLNGWGDPVEVETRTDSAGQFRLASPTLKRTASSRHPGLSAGLGHRCQEHQNTAV